MFERPSSGEPTLPDAARTRTSDAGAASARLASAPADAPGALLAGRYRIECYIASGGMGEVYRARDLTLEVPLALKVIHREIASDPAHLRRFKQEVLLARSVTHPNVCRIFDIGEDRSAGVHFLTMEFLHGETLAARIAARGSLPPAASLAIARQMADALDAAHRAGIVHRDFKSANVILVPIDAGERAVITDFGLAVTVAGSARGRPAPEFAGTPAYMSPEQVAGGPLGPASDLYAFGVVLFEMCTGTMPFHGATPLETARARLTAPPPSPASIAPVGDNWERAILRLLAQAPEQRFATALEAVLAIEGHSTAAEVRRHSLPAERDRFVGRAGELAALAAALEGSGGAHATPLLTLLGPGGCGKTRLALQYGWTSLPRWPGGVWFSDLSEARSADGIAAAVASALDVPLGKEDPVVQLGHALAGRGRSLVILDNFEQVAALAGETLGRWLARSAETRFLVTSQERLQLLEETTLTLEPLDPTTHGLELFETRARGHRPGFGIDDSNRGTVEEIVRRLDGLPLAVELAAARLRILSLEQLRHRLEDRFEILAGGARGRHATLATTLDWSWDLLEPWERTAVAQASIFEAGFTLEAGESVIDLSAHGQAPPVLDAIQSLLDKSWLTARVALGAPRFEMYATIREYAAVRLRADPVVAAGTAARHTAHFADLGTGAFLDGLLLHGGVARRNALHVDLDNILAACRRALLHRDGPAMAATYAAAGAALELRGPFDGLIQLGRDILQIQEDPRLRARVLVVLGQAEKAAGRLQEAGEDVEAAIALDRAAGDRRAEGAALDLLGNIRFEMGRREEARACLEAALAIHREVGNLPAEGKALSSLGNVYLVGDLEAALAHHQAGLAIHREVGNRVSEGTSLGNLAAVFRILGRLEEARAHHEAALAMHRETGYRRAEGITLGGLATILADEGRLEDALRAYEAALAIHRETGGRRPEGEALTSIGQLYMDLGRAEQARAFLEAGLAVHREARDRRYEGVALTHLGMLYMNEGRLREAREQIEAGIAIHREVGNIYAEASALGQLGELHHIEGRAQDARRCHAESVAILRSGKDPVGLAGALCRLGMCDADDGDRAAALAALSEAQALVAGIALGPESELLGPIEELRRRLGEGAA